VQGLSDRLAPLIAKAQAAEDAQKRMNATTIDGSGAADAFIRSLQEQTATLGMTQRQILEYRAAQLGIGDRAAPLISQLASVNKNLDGTGISARQTAAAMRMIPAQMTDIVTQLAGGQNPFLIMVQQGGQIKDSFGGIGPAISAVGSMINPLRVAVMAGAGSLAAFAYAAYQGATESDKINKQLILTGNYAGTSSIAVAGMAERIGAANGTVGKASEALGLVIATGKFARDEIEGIGLAAVAMNRATGQAFTDTISEFVKLADAPTKASADLNEKYHYLTLSVYDHIRSLEEQGRIQEAGEVAQNAFKDAMIERTAVIVAQQGFIERGWNAIRDSITGALDKLKSIGRVRSINVIEAELSGAQTEANGFKGDYAGKRYYDQRVATLKKELDAARLLDLQTDSAGVAKQIEADAVSAASWYDKALQGAKAGSAKAMEIQQLNTRTRELFARQAITGEKDARLAGVRDNGDSFSGGQYDLLLGNINKKYTDKGASNAAAALLQNQISARMQALKDAGAEEERVLRSNLDRIKTLRALGAISEEETLDRQYAARKTSLEKELVLAQQEVAEAAGLKRLAAIESAKAKEKKVRQEMLENEVATADARALLRNKEERDIQRFTDQLGRMLVTRQSAIQDSLAAVGMGDRAIDQMRRVNEVMRDIDNRAYDLTTQRAEGRLSEEQYQQRLEALQAYGRQRIEQEKSLNDQLAAVQADGQKGYDAAAQNYIDRAADVAGQTKAAYASLFDGLTDGFARLATGGKVSFEDLARSFAAALIKMEVQAAASKLLKAGGGGGGFLGFLGTIGGFLGMGGAGVSSGATTIGNYSSLGGGGSGLGLKLPSALGNVFDAGRRIPFAKGAAFSNTIQTSRQTFPLAGGYTGELAEAGPEAIMPLKRAADGSLGVRGILSAASAGQRAAAAPSMRVVVNNLGSPQDYTVQSLSREEVVLIARNQVHEHAEGVVASKLASSNSQMKSAMNEAFALEPRR
jgi:lambda family phage tail tape measure protein